MMNFFLVYDLKFKWLWKLTFIIYRLCTRFNLYINMLLKKNDESKSEFRFLQNDI